MKTYKIEITEALQRTIEVEANSEEDALNIINKEYKNGEIVLSADDFINKEIVILKEE